MSGVTQGPSFRAFDAADAARVQRLIHRTIDACYAGVYPPRAISYFKEFHSLDSILERGSSGSVIVAERGGEIIATGAVVGDEITGVFVDPEQQHHGLGAQVMDRLEAIARSEGHTAVRLAVSLPSRGFYEGRGYLVTEECSLDVGQGERLDYWEAVKPVLGATCAGGAESTA